MGQLAMRYRVLVAALGVMAVTAAAGQPAAGAAVDPVPEPVGTLVAAEQLRTLLQPPVHEFRMWSELPGIGTPSPLPDKPVSRVTQGEAGVAVQYTDGTSDWWNLQDAQWVYQHAVNKTGLTDLVGAGGQYVGGQAVYNWPFPSSTGVLTIFDWPATIPRTSRIADLVGGAFNALALTDTGFVLAGERGRGGFSNSVGFVPEALQSGGVVAIATSVAGNTNAAVLRTGEVVLWGAGAPVYPVPPDLCPATDVSLGRSAAAVICRDGSVQVFGAGAEPAGLTPVPTDLGPASRVAVADQYVMAVDAGGRIRAWGNGASVVPTDLTGVHSVSAGLVGVAVTDSSNERTVRLATAWKMSPQRYQVRWTPGATDILGGVDHYEIKTADLRTRVVPADRVASVFTALTVVPGQFPLVRPVFKGTNGALVAGEYRPVSFIDRPVKYVALGDSYSSGEGNPPYLNGTDVAGNKCHRSTAAYAWQLHDALGGSANIDLTFLPCSGALSRDVLLANHSNDEASQLSRIPSQPDVITLTLGGNDMGFNDIATACVRALNCTAGNGFADPSSDAQHLLVTLNRIRARAPGAKIYLITYPLPFADPDTWPSDSIFIPLEGLPLVPLSRQNGRFLRDYLTQMHLAVCKAATSAGAVCVDGRGAFNGHGLDSPFPWLTPIRMAGPLTPSQESLHPNSGGHVGFEQVLSASLDVPAPPGGVLAVEPITSAAPAYSGTAGEKVRACGVTFAGLNGQAVQLQERRAGRWVAVATSDPRVLPSSRMGSVLAHQPQGGQVPGDLSTAQWLEGDACWDVNTSNPFAGLFRWRLSGRAGVSSATLSEPFTVTVNA